MARFAAHWNRSLPRKKRRCVQHDPQLASGKYLSLTDPKHIFGFQNVILVINTSKLRQEGGQALLNIIDKVNKLLTTPAVIAMNKAVAIDKQAPAAVAQAFLKANGLI